MNKNIMLVIIGFGLGVLFIVNELKNRGEIGALVSRNAELSAGWTASRDQYWDEISDTNRKLRRETALVHEVTSDYVRMCGEKAQVVAERDMWKAYGDGMREWGVEALKHVDRDYSSVLDAMPRFPRRPAAPAPVEIPWVMAQPISISSNVVLRVYMAPVN